MQCMVLQDILDISGQPHEYRELQTTPCDIYHTISLEAWPPLDDDVPWEQDPIHYINQLHDDMQVYKNRFSTPFDLKFNLINNA